ncbi:MAG TPA: hypothetical protein VGP82_09605 [Ktedonobacterales bacterium]|nr:hypothetical protein [Ktedonobacterales bacterium]
MFQVLRFRAESSYAVINAALTLHPARTLALVFAAGVHPLIAESGQLATLFVRAHAIGKDVTIVGGDTELRASAVAAGFAAATTLDDWRRAKHSAAQPIASSGRHNRIDQPGLLVLESKQQDLNRSGGAWLAEPPHHIATLLDARAPQSRVTPPMHVFTDAELDARDAEAALQASERYEDEITSRIRATSELDASWAI